ncbi:hypothetical protein LTS18_008221 [Coniosporium uncinatum]|uniref:Uncharacterized protein n=1 Tax=Coniosporium uncinatum TaxID=93489 RepID=A0ACC3DAM4_9PEZI|nr:hypothetical protein LTS18_008221 [Coniosporium uncinatum]
MPGHTHTDSLGPFPGRTLTTRQRLVRAITNPDTIWRESTSPGSPPPQSYFKQERLEQSQITRSLFGTKHDIAPITHRPKPSVSQQLAPVIDMEEPLFSPLLMSVEVAGGLPEGYTARPLRRSDFGRGYLDVLRVIGKVGAVGERAWGERFEWLKRNNDTYYVVVILNEEDRVVAGGTLMVERKL